MLFFLSMQQKECEVQNCARQQKDRGTVTEIYYRYSVSVFSCFVIWPEGLFRLSDSWQARNFWQCAK